MFKSNRGLWALLALQAFCAAFFVFDAVSDFLGWETKSLLRQMDTFEYVIAAALVLAVALTTRELLKLAARNKRMAQQLGIASGAFHDILEQHFNDWALTASEREVATLAIKGLSIAEIAQLRDTKEGTIKAQSAAIYRKADVTGRLQLLSLFIEELMSESLLPSTAK